MFEGHSQNKMNVTLYIGHLGDYYTLFYLHLLIILNCAEADSLGHILFHSMWLGVDGGISSGVVNVAARAILHRSLRPC